MDIDLEINASHDAQRLARRFHSQGTLRIENFLQPACAAMLYTVMVKNVRWRTLVLSQQQLLGTPLYEAGASSFDHDPEAIALANSSARSGQAALYDVDRLYPEDEVVPASAAASDEGLGPFELRISNRLLELIRIVSAEPLFQQIAVQANRFRPGHFEMFHSGTWSADKTGKRRATFILNLTPEWRPDWGGLLQYRSRDAACIRGWMPTFNSLDLITFPRGWWVSAVSTIAQGARLSLNGRLYSH